MWQSVIQGVFYLHPPPKKYKKAVSRLGLGGWMGGGSWILYLFLKTFTYRRLKKHPAVLHASLMPFAHILITDPEGSAVYKFLHLSATFFQNYTAQLNAG